MICHVLSLAHFTRKLYQSLVPMNRIHFRESGSGALVDCLGLIRDQLVSP